MAAISRKMKLTDIQTTIAPAGLDIYGAFHPDADDMSEAKTLVMLGPSADFWNIFTKSPEYTDKTRNPIDRWSTRVLTDLANTVSAHAIFPFGGPPYAPFIAWAKQSGRAWASPVGMLIHDTTGLMVSYRGALAFDEILDLPTKAPKKPCDTCETKPCVVACPVDALGPNGYNVQACHAYLDTDAGAECMTMGCIARRSCPISVGANRQDAQSALHMRAFRGR
ncbi:ferredoxin [Amylibacter sp. SFDW26]|uniref:ferredoxin n=1 Tax=Amylibacter sp. SFDW26 TaxID=2652722 RepID=UPI001D016532|nr:ferredoxin [Amylibacter sp. SFDW26]